MVRKRSSVQFREAAPFFFALYRDYFFPNFSIKKETRRFPLYQSHKINYYYSDNLSTFKTILILRIAPKRIITNFKSLLDVKVIPDFKFFSVSIIVFKNIPINKAMTDPPIKCFGRILSINCVIKELLEPRRDLVNMI